MLPSLTELDLSENLLSDWKIVAELAAALPSLRALNLSGNRLALPSLADAMPLPSLPSLAGLHTLVLNACGVSWEQAVAVARQLPGLRELHLCGNRLASLQLPAAAAAVAAADMEGLLLTPGDPASSSIVGSSSSNSAGSTAALLAAAFPHLELLDLEDNALANWHADVALLSQLPRLRSLLLSGNQLADVQYGGGDRAQACIASALPCPGTPAQGAAAGSGS
jgi:Leucine-rich repeat (LRR) protein